MRKRWLAVLILGAVLVSASSAGGSSSKSGGTFRVATSSGIDSLNPYVAFNQDAYSMFEYIYPLLVQYDQGNKKFVPDFASSWKTSKDGKTWTFTTVSTRPGPTASHLPRPTRRGRSTRTSSTK